MGGRRGLAATVIVLVTTIVIFVPVLFSLVVLTRQALGFFDWALPHLDPDQRQAFLGRDPARALPGPARAGSLRPRDSSPLSSRPC